MTDVPRPGLSAVLIARDEEQNLPLTLPPLIAAADEVVLVDTGSKDRTADLARDLGCRVFQHAWREDFSEVKNFAISQASYEHVLSVDCDEELVLSQDLRSFLASGGPGASRPAFLVTIENVVVGAPPVSSLGMRLFLADPRIRFRNPVHESICESVLEGWPSYRPEQSPVTLRHHGYAAGNNEAKFQRNVRILRDWVRQEPDSIFGCFKLGANLQHLGEPDALLYLERAFQLVQRSESHETRPYVPRLVESLAAELDLQGRGVEAGAVRSIGDGLLLEAGLA